MKNLKFISLFGILVGVLVGCGQANNGNRPNNDNKLNGESDTGVCSLKIKSGATNSEISIAFYNWKNSCNPSEEELSKQTALLENK